MITDETKKLYNFIAGCFADGMSSEEISEEAGRYAWSMEDALDVIRLLHNRRTFFITLHNTETEEIVGHVAPVIPMDFDRFDDLMRLTWKEFQTTHEDFSIEDFVEWHNEQYPKNQIDWVIGDFIQLSE